MTNDNTIKIQGKTYNLDDIKAGIQRKDFESAGNNVLLSLFDILDKQDKYGFKNNTLDINETKELIQNLINAAGDDKLSKGEAEQYLKSLGLKDVKVADLTQFIDVVLEKSNDIKETTYDKKRNSTVIEYKEGYYDEVLYDGRHAVKAKESKDTSLQTSLELNVPFMYMADKDGRRVVPTPNEEHDYRIDVEDIITKNNLDKSKAKPIYNDTFNPPRLEGIRYFDDNGNEVLKIGYEETWRSDISKFFVNDDGKTVINSIEYKDGDNWVKLDISHGLLLSSVSTLNSDKSITLSKTSYSDHQTRTAQSTYNPETGRTTEIEFDYISGRQKTIKELDEKGRAVKIKHLNVFYKTFFYRLYTEINEYVGNDYNPLKTKKFDKNNQLIEPEEKTKQETIYVDSLEEYRKRMDYGENYDLFTKLENDINDSSARELLKTTIDNIRNTKLQQNGELLSLVSENDKAAIMKLMSNMLDKCEKSTNFDEIRRTLGLFGAQPRVIIYPLLQQLHNEQPDGTLNQINYQGFTGNCWFLSATGSVAEVPEGGQEYISSFFEKDENGNIVDKDGNVTVILNGGKNKYVITPKDRAENSHFSIGDPNMRILEIAFDKYAQEFGINEKQDLSGGYPRFALEIYSGNKAVYTERKDGKLGVTINNEFIELNEQNADRLAEIPICIKDMTTEDLKELAKFQNRTAMCCSSYHYMEGHALYLKGINENSVQVKEPNNTENIATYSTEAFLETYKWDEKTIFILPKPAD